MASPDFQRFLSRNAGLGLEKQYNLLDEVGSPDWEADLITGVLTLGDRDFPLQLLGTESEESSTWLWAWANTSLDPGENVLTLARQLRAGGETAAIDEFTDAQSELDVIDGFQVATAVSGHLGPSGAFFRGPYDGGAAFFYIPEGLVLPAPRAERVATLLVDAISIWELDHRNLVEGYASARHLVLEQREHWYLQVPSADGSDGRVQIRFDGAGRIQECTAVASG